MDQIESNLTTTDDEEINKIYKTELFIDLQPTTLNSSELACRCHKCKYSINCDNENEIKFNNRSYHVNCFTCIMCNDNLNNLTNKKFQINNDGEAICTKCERKQANKCFLCQQAILREESIILENKYYHKNCFQCFQCQKSLINEKNFRIHSLKLCCFQCYTEHFAIRCEKCSELISNGITTSYNGKKYHPDCFQCRKCKTNIIDSKFTIHDDQICCIECYNEHFTEKCFQCLKSLSNRESIIFNENTYHLDCFKCEKCNKTINDLKFATYNSQAYCIQCYNENFAVKCYQCLKPISVGKSIVYNENKYHSNCFRCFQCNNILNDSTFYNENSKPCCIKCYNEYFAEKCAQCLKSITIGRSIIFDKKTYHPDCFRCCQCNKIMNDCQCRTENDKPYCIQCYDQYFRPRCSKCSEPIIDQYTMFEGKKFHSNCFICVKCRRIINNKENFYRDQLGILCSNCIL
ncbi:unnamed protein product [Rotaria magnacalcarata]|uniref:LIM zinc-binding domain-containing protein n=2 Tax=Rotaria magnacalcarata TaxID=392030 RepID=A0A816QLU5_9BILA|nr:unnamed protein product [Rotaria magnacalcarata]CAF4033316.1 unnamed protein product [Rotaria magnacalcarata]